MQTTIPISSNPQTRQYHVPGVGTQKNIPGRKRSQAKTGRVGKSNNGFLTTVFTPLHVSLFYPVFSESNYRYIYDSLTNYSRLLKRELSVKYDPFNLSGLCDRFREILPENNELRLEINEEESKMSAWLIDTRYEEELLYFLPCGIIDHSEGLFKEILISFFRLLREKQQFGFITETCFYEMMDEQLSMDEEQELDSDWVETFNEYKSGYKKALFDNIASKPQYSISRLQKQVNDFRPKCKRESRLKLLVEEGLRLLSQRKRLFSFSISPDGSYEDFAIGLDSVIQLTYESDLLEEESIRYINDCAQNSGFDFICPAALLLTPQTKRRLKPKKFVLEFMDWLNKLNDELYHLRN